MYWAVIGVISAAEMTCEWLINWSELLSLCSLRKQLTFGSKTRYRLPFYYDVKTIALLWLTLPQIQGSSYVYIHHLHPWLSAHESDIDTFLLSAKARAKEAGLDYARRMWGGAKDMLIREMLGQGGAGQSAQLPPPQTSQSQQQQHPVAAPPSHGWFPFASHFVQQYGPSAVAAGHAFFHPMESPSANYEAAATSSNRPPAAPRFIEITQEQELLGLAAPTHAPRTAQTPPSASLQSSPAGSAVTLSDSFENIQDEEILALRHSASSPSAAAATPPKTRQRTSPQGNAATTRSSWSFWAGQARGEQEEHIKKD